MPQSAQVQFLKRAKEALEQGNTKFVARGENRVLFEEMKRKFEQEKNAQSEPDSKRVKLPALAAAPKAESNSSDYSSSSDSENESSPSNSSCSHDKESIELAVETESDEQIKELNDEAPRQPAKQTDDDDHEAAMAWQAEMERKEKAYKAYSKTPEANRVWCMADCQPAVIPSGHYKDHMFDADLAQRCAEHDRIMKGYEARKRALALVQQD